jgi:predicted ATPase
MYAIERLTVRGYKSIRELRDFQVRSLNVLIGANGAGKSNFIGFFRLLGQLSARRLQLHVELEGKADALLHFGRKETQRIEASVSFSNASYDFSLLATHDNRLVFEEESIRLGTPGHKADLPIRLGTRGDETRLHDPDLGDTQPVRTALENWRIYHFHDTSDTANVKRGHAINDTLRLKPDAANLAAWLRKLHLEHESHYLHIVDTIRSVAPFFDDFVHREDGRETVELEWLEKRDPDTPMKAHRLSDGTLRFICLATLLLQPWHLMPDVILIDEPELGLHPYAVTLLADLLKRASERKKVIVATQSVELVNCLDAEDIVVVDRVDDASVFSRLGSEHLRDWLADYSLGELWKRNVLGGGPAR